MPPTGHFLLFRKVHNHIKASAMSSFKIEARRREKYEEYRDISRIFLKVAVQF